MGNSKKGTAVEEKLVFTGDQQDFEAFRTPMHNDLEEKNRQWVTLAAQAICKVYQSIVAERTAKSATTPMQTDLYVFSKEDHKRARDIKQYDAPVTLDLALVKNKKDVIGSAWAEHDKLKITEEHLKTWHESIDQSYIVKCNRAVLKILHNDIYPMIQQARRTQQSQTKGCSTSLTPQRFSRSYRVRILGTKTNGKVDFGKFLTYKCGVRFFSNSRSSRI
jgi:hypothetical protein